MLEKFETTERPSLRTLASLSTLQDLDEDQLKQLSGQLVVSRAPKGTRLLSHGSTDESTFYLLEGKLRLEAVDGAVQTMSHEDPSAANPVARLRPSRYDVTAATPIRFLRIDGELLENLVDAAETIQLYEVSEETAFGDLALENQLTVRLYEDLNADRVLLPSLPDVAIRVGRAVVEEDSDASTVARIVETDPAISAKLLKAANSARFAGRAQVGRIEDAVVRLGMRTTHHLVVTFALRELFRSPSPSLRERMRDLWEHSCRVAALAHVLAKKTPGVDAEFALLAGLVHDIGALAVLAYAGEVPAEELDPADLESTVQSMRARIGGLLLRRWHLPPELATVAEEAEHWDRQGSDRPDYADLVIVAQLHSYVGTPRQAELPAIDGVPAYGKLELGELSPEASVALLDEAAEEIRETEALLGG
jgi:HD-like signal output (HDOD) protein